MNNGIYCFLFGAIFGMLLIMDSEAKDVCYTAYGAEIIPTDDVRNLLVSVNFYDTTEQLVLAVGEDVAAWSECEVHPDKNIGWCEIWVVRPKRVLGDPAMDALGHEVLHGLWGDYHKD